MLSGYKPIGIKYFDATIASVTYMDNTTWEARGLDVWAKEVSDAFTIEGYQEKTEELKEDALLAESNPYIQILGSEKNENRPYFTIDIENVGEKTIKDFTIIVLQYDENGYAVNASLRVGTYWDATVVRNAKNYTFESANIKADIKCQGRSNTIFESECATYKVIIYAIEFIDGSIWTNDYAMQWQLYNENER